MSEFFRKGTAWNEDDLDLEMRTLDGPPPPDFDCGAEDQNEFLYTRAWADACHGISVTHMLHIKGIPAAYVTLLSDRIQLGPREKPKGVTYQMVPALKVGQLAVDRRFAGRGLGRYLLGFTVQLAAAYSDAVTSPSTPNRIFSAGMNRRVSSVTSRSSDTAAHSRRREAAPWTTWPSACASISVTRASKTRERCRKAPPHPDDGQAPPAHDTRDRARSERIERSGALGIPPVVSGNSMPPPGTASSKMTSPRAGWTRLRRRRFPALVRDAEDT